MIHAQIDRGELESSLRRFSKAFGDNNAQAVCRWGVQTCRELALETQSIANKAKNEKPKQKQEGAIISDARNVLLVCDEVTSTGKGYKITNQGKSYRASASQVFMEVQAANEWIEQHRTRKRRRTAKLPVHERKIVSAQLFKKIIKARMVNAGMAKGGWLGAGKDLASFQKGSERITIGKNYLSYTQKHSKFGRASNPRPGWSPSTSIQNTVRHTASTDVVKTTAFDKAAKWGLRKTVKWYATAVRKQEQQQKQPTYKVA